MDSKQTSGALNVATAAAIDAGKFIAQSISQLDRIKVNRKSRSQLVSEIDVRAEQSIIYQLEEAYPEFNVFAEESGDKNRENPFCWIIDPLDGTHNFLHGHPHCCVSIALQHTTEGKSQIVLAVIYDALRNELFTARKGAGAQLDGRRIRVSEINKLTDALLCTGFPDRDNSETKGWLQSFATILPRVQSIHRTGCPALDLAYVACGRYDGFWEFGLRDWNISAGSLLVQEAGGLISDVNGDTNLDKSGNLVAGNPRVHEKLQHLVSGSLR